MQSVLINDRVEKIKEDEQRINEFVEEYKPFIASCTQRITRRFVRYGEDDELSIALIAFVEAIRSYDSTRGSFLSFAQNVIKRRIIDHYRKEKRFGNVVSLTEYYKDSEDEKDLSAAESIERYSTDEISEYRRLELEELKKELEKWEISFFELVDASPKHDKTRKMCSDILQFLLSQPELVKSIKNKKTLAIAEIEKALRIPRKNIERMRKYILATLIIKTGDYQFIKDYIR